MPGFWLSGIHKIKTVTLIKNVSIPTLKFKFRERPWAKTLQGEAPVKETINNAKKNIPENEKKNGEQKVITPKSSSSSLKKKIN